MSEHSMSERWRLGQVEPNKAIHPQSQPGPTPDDDALPPAENGARSSCLNCGEAIRYDETAGWIHPSLVGVGVLGGDGVACDITPVAEPGSDIIPPGGCGICGKPLSEVGTSRCYEAHGVIPPEAGPS